MRGVLVLRRVELHLDRSLIFVDIKGLPESLVTLGDYLHPDLALGHFGDVGDTLLGGAHFPTRTYHFPEFDDRASTETHDHFSTLDRLAVGCGDYDLQRGQVGGPQGDRCWQQNQQEQ